MRYVHGMAGFERARRRLRRRRAAAVAALVTLVAIPVIWVVSSLAGAPLGLSVLVIWGVTVARVIDGEMDGEPQRKTSRRTSSSTEVYRPVSVPTRDSLLPKRKLPEG